MGVRIHQVWYSGHGEMPLGEPGRNPQGPAPGIPTSAPSLVRTWVGMLLASLVLRMGGGLLFCGLRPRLAWLKGSRTACGLSASISELPENVTAT